MEKQARSCPLSRMIGYSVGDCANSLIECSLSGFAMMYYTDALGLNPSSAGMVMLVAIFWNAFATPIMGHITDNTRSRFGRRHVYILFGGIGMVIGFLFLWFVPEIFKNNMQAMFLYLLTVNLFVRTAMTVFGVPFTALGYELCTEYEGRVKLQSVRGIMGMAANLCGPALAWSIFFSNNEITRATHVQGNYLRMGTSFSIASLLAVLIVVFVTRRLITDSRNINVEGNNIKGFLKNMKEIISDFYPRYVFACIIVVTLGIALVGALQIYLYEHFMKLGGIEKTIAHGGTMVGTALGALSASFFTRKFDKKGAVCFGVALSVLCNFILATLFLPEILKPGQTLSLGTLTIPAAFMVFVLFHSLYWFGNGIMFPISGSMMADVSEINQIKTGFNKDGAYSAVFAFAGTCAIGIGSLICGYSLTLVGFEAGTPIQRPEVIWRLCAVTLVVGPIISMISLALIRFYPVTKELLEDMRKESEKTR